MIDAEKLFLDMINNPVRQIRARVELLKGSTLVDTFRYRDRLINFPIERVGDTSRFFGFGICQKLNVKLLDKDRVLNITTDNTFNVAFGVGNDYVDCYPIFKVTEVNRDEETNGLSVTAYDPLYEARKHTISEIELDSYTIEQLATACARVLGIPFSLKNINDDSFKTFYDGGANFDGTETIREVLDAIAEATQTIYYVDNNFNLTFQRLDIKGNADLTIDKSKYVELSSSTNRKLVAITHATELGDNVTASLGVSGSKQYVRNNPFWDLRNDIGTLLDKALVSVGGLTINQFDCAWRGNFLLEIGDKINLVTKNNDVVTSYVLDDSIYYDGYLSETTQWRYTEDEAETEDNPTSLGDALKQTYARVDKANKRIDLVASDVNSTNERLSSLEINTESITASVENIQKSNNEAFESINGEMETLTNKVNASMTSEQVKLEINSELSKGTTKVETNTGFTFNDEGLTVEKSNSEMKTQITEDGMTVYKNNEAVLTANNIGVDAVNLHATTYLIIGTNSRFEDYGDNRTGCFWIGN